jgi:hypothetical protein
MQDTEAHSVCRGLKSISTSTASCHQMHLSK